MTTDRELLKQYISAQQVSLTALVSDWVLENSAALLQRGDVLIGPVTSDGADLLYRAFASYYGFERKIMYFANTSGDYFAVRFVGDLEQPDQTQYQLWESSMIDFLDRSGTLPTTEVTSWGQAVVEHLSQDEVFQSSLELQTQWLTPDLRNHMLAEEHYRRTGQWIRPTHAVDGLCSLCAAIELTISPNDF